MLVPVSTTTTRVQLPPEPIPDYYYEIQNIAVCDRKATRVPRLPFKRYIPSRPPASLLSVQPQSSILAPHVLNAMKMALITGKHGISPHDDIFMDTRKRKPEDDEMTMSSHHKKNKFIPTRDVMRAEAAYGIARNLVAWMDGIDIIDDSHMLQQNNDEKFEEDVEIKHEEMKQELGEIKHEDVKEEYGEMKHEELTSSCDDQLEEECRIEIKMEDAKHDGEEKKRDDWYHMNGQALSFDINFSYLEDALRAHDLSPSSNSDIVTPPTELSLSSELSMESQASASMKRCASASHSCKPFPSPAPVSFPSGSPVSQPFLQYDAIPLIPLSSPPSSPMPISLPLLPTLSEMHTYLPLPTASTIHDKLETQQALFPNVVEGWQTTVLT